MFDGKTPNWYHFSCFFGKQRPKGVADIAHFESIRWEDQEKIKSKLGMLTCRNSLKQLLIVNQPDAHLSN